MEPQLNPAISATAASHDGPIETDAVIVGAGPVGLFQVFELGDLSLLEHVGAVGERERETGHLVHEENRRRFGAQTVEHAEEVVHHLRRESERRLIEQQ